MNRNPNLPVMDQLIKGRIYKIECRNLACGVWNGVNGFTGIRTKFGSRFLFTEYHWDYSEHIGTVYNAEDTGVDIPNDLDLKEDLGVKDQTTDKWLERKFVDNHFDGWYYADTGEKAENVKPVGIHNKELFNFLNNYQQQNKNYLDTYIGEEVKRCDV